RRGRGTGGPAGLRRGAARWRRPARPGRQAHAAAAAGRGHPGPRVHRAAEGHL
ncbi:unnamed protein product, partial [Prorocentrum cordatum]